MRARLAFSFITILTLSCGKSNLPKYANLDRLRILALVVDAPELQNPAAGTQNVQLDVYLSDIKGTGSIELEVRSCLDPGVGRGAIPTCANGQHASLPQTLTVTPAGGAAVDEIGEPERTGKLPSGAITVALDIPAGLLSNLSAAYQVNGIAYIITVTARRGSESTAAFRRVLISTKTPNQNPALSDLLVNGASLNALPAHAVNLSFSAGSAPESYLYVSDSGTSRTETETFETTWFVSDGEMKQNRTLSGESAEWKPPAAAPAGRQTVVVGVLRDGRGGEAVLVRKF